MPTKIVINKLEASATGCEVLSASLQTWVNHPGEFNPGNAAKLTFSRGLTAMRFESSDNALEALALQLETLARKVRNLKTKEPMVDLGEEAGEKVIRSRGLEFGKANTAKGSQ